MNTIVVANNKSVATFNANEVEILDADYEVVESTPFDDNSFEGFAARSKRSFEETRARHMAEFNDFSDKVDRDFEAAKAANEKKFAEQVKKNRDWFNAQ